MRRTEEDMMRPKRNTIGLKGVCGTVNLQDLIESIDIIDYISQFVDLEEKGGEFWG